MARANRKFVQAIKRARKLNENSKKIRDDEIRLDNIRMAVVLSVAAMDNYFTSKFRDLIVKYLDEYDAGEDLIVLLEKAGLNTRTALELLWMERPMRRIGTLIERYFDRYTTQRFDVIDNLFKSIGIQNLCENAERKTGRKTLRSSITRLVEKRHFIVHDADINSHAKPRNIDADRIERRINDLEKFVLACDEILDNKVYG